MNTQLLVQLLVNGFIVGTLYGVVAMSFVLIYKATQVVNFAQGEFLLVGAWVCWWLLTKYQLPFYLGMPITLVFMLAFGVALQVCVLRPMIGEPVISVIMVTIGLSTVFQAAMKWIFGTNLQPFPPIFATQTVGVLGLQMQTVYLMSLVVSVVMMAAMAWFFQSSKHGLAMRATAFRSEEHTSELQSLRHLVCRLLLEKKKKQQNKPKTKDREQNKTTYKRKYNSKKHITPLNHNISRTKDTLQTVNA